MTTDDPNDDDSASAAQRPPATATEPATDVFCAQCGAPATLLPLSAAYSRPALYWPRKAVVYEVEANSVIFSSRIDQPTCAEHAPPLSLSACTLIERLRSDLTWTQTAAQSERDQYHGYREETRSEIERLRSELEDARGDLAFLAQCLDNAASRAAAALEIVRVVAEADNSDSSVCYQLCNVRWYGGETDAEEMEMRHDAPCVIERARALLAPTPGASAASSAEASAPESDTRDTP